MKSLTLALMLLAVLVAAGCSHIPFLHHSSKEKLCKEPEGYAQATEAKPLTIPPGLENPDTRNALRIPDLNTPAPPPRKRGEGCLDEPPSYATPKPKQAS